MNTTGTTITCVGVVWLLASCTGQVGDTATHVGDDTGGPTTPNADVRTPDVGVPSPVDDPSISPTDSDDPVADDSETGSDMGAPDLTEPEIPDPDPCAVDAIRPPGRAPLRRLTVTEYDNSVRDLFGDTTGPASRIVDHERGVLVADNRVVSSLLAEQYMHAAEDVAARATAPGRLDDLMACDRGAVGDDACARQLFERLAPRVFRRPADISEIEGLLALFDATRAEGFDVGIATALEAMLQSPSFLYRVEIVDGAGDARVRLDGYQLATRLSFFFWATTPDTALLDAAAAGELDSVQGAEAHARRLVADPQAAEVIQRFVERYLELDKLEHLEKDAALFETWNDGIPDLFREEVRAFVDEVLEREAGSWVTLLSAPWSMMNDELAAYYGLAGPAGASFERVELDPRYHAGLLTQGATTATRARTYETSPIHRGMFVRGNLMCGLVPDVPEGLDITPPPPDPTLTTRERLARHREEAYCASCHDQLDPLGFAFEHFDAAGRFRSTEHGLAIDATGELVNSDVDGAFDGAPSLAARLVESPATQECFARRWLPAALGRGYEDEDPCVMAAITAQFAAGRFDIRELLVALATSDLFLYRIADQDTLTEVTP